MKKTLFFGMLALFAVVVLAVTPKGENVLLEHLPKITTVSVSGRFYSGGDLEPWTLNEAEIQELDAWIRNLSMKPWKKEAPNKTYCGGTSWQFSVNQGELIFSYVSIDRAYLWYDGEWYEILSPKEPPLGLDR